MGWRECGYLVIVAESVWVDPIRWHSVDRPKTVRYSQRSAGSCFLLALHVSRCRFRIERLAGSYSTRRALRAIVIRMSNTMENLYWVSSPQSWWATIGDLSSHCISNDWLWLVNLIFLHFLVVSYIRFI